jgi:hypothetical protein
MQHKPTREGEYEGREKRTGATLVVYWRTLTDETKPGWYYQKGCWGPFLLWQDAAKDMTAWRGLSAPPKKEQSHVQ